MRQQRSWAWIGAVSLVVCGAAAASAAPPWANLIPFKRVDADPNKGYRLTEDDGPWLIMCRSFAGATAEQDAHTLVLELRQKFKLKAYVHKQHYDFTKLEKDVVVLGIDKDITKGRKRMKPANPVEFTEVAVLVGNFDSVEDPQVTDVLEKIKHARPPCLEIASGRGTSQRYAGLREIQRVVSAKLSATSEIKDKGPMRMAFVTRNPLLPEEYFAPKGLDPLVVEMNKEVEHSLLDNPGAFTVRVASFSGESTMSLDKIQKASRTKVTKSRLQEGAEKANRICTALRAKGIDAYEFHDRHESWVTVGSFDWISQQGIDGRDVLNPNMVAIMERFKAKQGTATTNQVPLPTQIAGIPLDFQPIPVPVPKQSLGRALSGRMRE